jgi:hypothetical protein
MYCTPKSTTDEKFHMHTPLGNILMLLKELRPTLKQLIAHYSTYTSPFLRITNATWTSSISGLITTYFEVKNMDWKPILHFMWQTNEPPAFK